MFISSTSNEKVKRWLKLKQKKYRDLEKKFLIEDKHMLEEALKNDIVLEIITTEDKKYNVLTYQVTYKIMKLLSSQSSSSKVIAVCKMIPEKEISGNILILDNIQDPGNLGTIIRSAVAFQFKTVVLSETCVDLYNDKVLRATEGMIFNVNVIRRNLNEFINNLDNSYLLVTTDVKEGVSIKELQYKHIAIVIGNEGSGVSQEIANKCHHKVNIKMTNNCESLNAGVSASILMYEVYNEFNSSR